jgi:mono/diheme cytochrome c family protein
LSRRLAIVLLPVGLAAAVAFSARAAPPEPPGFKLGGDAKKGREVFLKRCALCHGETGDGRGRLRVDPPPADLKAPGVVDERSDWEIYLVIRDGGPAIGLSGKMLAWGKISSDQDIRDVAAYVRSLAPAH